MANVPQPVDIFAEVEEPICAELLSIERLEQRAESLAATQTVTNNSDDSRPLIPRVTENGRVLLEYYRATARAMQQEETITPAAEWLVDNFHIVEEQLRKIRDDMSPGLYRRLPKLASGHLQGYPRVFGIAWAFLAHMDSRFDPEVLRRFVSAYQRVQPLTIGELWAIAITLRIVLVENLRRLAEPLVRSLIAREQAEVLADSLVGTAGQSLVAPATVLQGFENKLLERAFAVQLVQRLRDLDPKMVGPIQFWLNERLAAQGTTADEIVRAECQQQAAMNVTIRNIIMSMRLTTEYDWQAFFESVSVVDELLCNGSHFAAMDFATRDYYRHAIEDLSRGSAYTEIEVTKRALQRAKRARTGPRNDEQSPENRQSDPGYYLIAQGRRDFEDELGFHVPWRRRLLRLYVRAAEPGYLGTIVVLTAIILALPLMHAREMGLSAKYLALLAVLAAVPASDIAIAFLNRAITDLLGPRTLARLELRDGVPEELRTIIAVPTLLTSKDAIKEHIDRLEVHYLANPAGDLRFALLSDWIDASTESLQGDDELLAVAVVGMASLNKRHGPPPGGGDRFFLFHRKRVWNECEQKWMGWERKRGKLHELNQLLRGSKATTFIAVGGRSLEAIPGVRYVITLDADTRLPRDTAARLVGTMAHPLNRPKFSTEEGRVVDGYSIVQPRITPSLATDREGSLFQEVFSGPRGIDPYASAVSDVYQDLFREGSYTGKGIYEIDSFEAALAGKAKENTLLSHDLFEGIFARVALATDIELFDEFPSHYEAAAARQHRWARGDWQLLSWIFGSGGLSKEGRSKIKIPAIGRAKMLDNLRRTLSAPCMFLTLLVGWLMPQISPWMWTGFVLATISIPALIPFFAGRNPRISGIFKRSQIRGVLSDLSLGAYQIGMTVTLMAYQAWLMSDAILRTLGRLFVTHRNLLQWIAAAQAKHAVDLNIFGMYKRMIASVLLATAAITAVAFGRPSSLPVAIPFAFLWVCAPVVARWISLPSRLPDQEPLSSDESKTLRLTSRRTWRFFETFVSSADNFLPLDNFQEHPNPVVAHRTSPTNMGLYLLSTLAARDFGWIGTQETAERLEATLQTMNKLERFRGHFYNWYDTCDLHPLDPKFVSTVDSGNIAGHLVALGNGCLKLIQESSIEVRVLSGVNDALLLLRETLGRIADVNLTHSVLRKQLSNAIDALAALLDSAPTDVADWAARFVRLKERVQTMTDIALTMAQELGSPPDSELRAWAEATRACIESHARDAGILIPWLRLDPKEVIAMAKRPVEHAPEWVTIEPFFLSLPTLADAPERFEAAVRELTVLGARLLQDPLGNRDVLTRVDTLIQAIQDAAEDSVSLNRHLLDISQTSRKLFAAMDFSFLFDRSRKLFSIGYRGTDGTLDPGCYDLLASEARLTSFIAIAKGDVPSSHWFRLGRALTPVGRGSALISWSGSMFEYLMPALVMRPPAGSLLSQTHEQVVQRQIEYGKERGVPWGISESAYNARDIDFTYQYSSFGVPELGLKRGLNEDLIIAPYATALAAMIEPSAAIENLRRLAQAGGLGVYGFYEALDYTGSRLPEGKNVAVIRAYMAHHQGMTLVAAANVLNDGVMQARFHAEPIMQATELLLQECTPRDVLVARRRSEEVIAATRVRELVSGRLPKLSPPVISTACGIALHR